MNDRKSHNLRSRRRFTAPPAASRPFLLGLKETAAHLYSPSSGSRASSPTVNKKALLAVSATLRVPASSNHSFQLQSTQFQASQLPDD